MTGTRAPTERLDKGIYSIGIDPFRHLLWVWPHVSTLRFPPNAQPKCRHQSCNMQTLTECSSCELIWKHALVNLCQCCCPVWWAMGWGLPAGASQFHREFLLDYTNQPISSEWFWHYVLQNDTHQTSSQKMLLSLTGITGAVVFF